MVYWLAQLTWNARDVAYIFTLGTISPISITGTKIMFIIFTGLSGRASEKRCASFAKDGHLVRPNPREARKRPGAGAEG